VPQRIIENVRKRIRALSAKIINFAEVLAFSPQVTSTDARRVTGRPRIRPQGHRCRTVRDGTPNGGRARFSSYAAIAAKWFSVRARRSACCCAERFVHFK
jgi:hypothetical protein